MKEKSRNQGRIARIGALFLVIIGILILGFNLGFIPAELKSILFSWQAILIVIGIFMLIRKRFVESCLLIAIGLFFLAPNIGSNFSNFCQLYWPILLIIAGLLLFFKYKQKKAHYVDVEKSIQNKSIRDDADYIDRNVLLSGIDEVVFSSDFKGGDINVALGEIKLDLRHINSLNSNNMLVGNIIFGSIIVYIPSDWKLNVQSGILFGDINDRRTENLNLEANAKTFNLKCSVMFGSVEIR